MEIHVHVLKAKDGTKWELKICMHPTRYFENTTDHTPYLQRRMTSKAFTAQALGGPWCTSTNNALDLEMVLKLQHGNNYKNGHLNVQGTCDILGVCINSKEEIHDQRIFP